MTSDANAEVRESSHRRLDIGLDLDGVFYPWQDVHAGWVEEVKGLRPGSLRQFPEWAYYKRPLWGPMSSAEFLEHYAAAVQAGVLFTEGHPLPGSLKAAEDLARRGHRLHFITAREIPGVTAHEAWAKTAEWLNAWGFPVDSLTVSDDKAARRTDVFLDDAPHNIDALHESGHPRPVIWTRDWNLDHPGERVRCWAEFIALVDRMAGD